MRVESYGPTGPAIEAVYTALVAGSIDAIMGMTRDGYITSWNPAAVEMYGYSIDEALGRPLAALFPEARRHEADEILKTLDAEGRLVQFETEHVGRGGSPVEVSMNMSPIRDEEGHMIAASAMIRDISVRRRHEAGARARAGSARASFPRSRALERRPRAVRLRRLARPS